MAARVKITTAFPSVLETAKRLGVSKGDVRVLSDMAERSERTGVFALPGPRRVTGVARKASAGRKRAIGKAEKNLGRKLLKMSKQS